MNTDPIMAQRTCGGKLLVVSQQGDGRYSLRACRSNGETIRAAMYTTRQAALSILEWWTGDDMPPRVGS